MRYHAVFFDLDGTLLDSVPMIIRVTGDTLAAMGIQVDDETLRHAIGVPLKVQAHRFAPGREQQFLEDYRAAYLPHASKDSRLFPGTKQMLDELRANDVLIGLVTSKNARGTSRAIELSGLTGKFDCIITADDVQQYKPHPEPLEKAMSQLGVAPAESLYVGDSAYDIDMAQRAGVRMIGVTWGARTRDELELICPDGVVDNWQEFLETIKS